MIGQGLTCWSKATIKLEGSSWWFWADQQPYAWNYDWQPFLKLVGPSWLQSTIEASGIEWPTLRYHIPCMVHIMELPIGAFRSSLCVKGCAKSCEPPQRDQQFRAINSIGIEQHQRNRKEGNASINMVSAIWPVLGNIINNVCISRNVDSAETDLHIAVNADSIDYSDTRSSKQVHLLIYSLRTNLCATDYESENMMDFNTEVAWGSLPMTRIHPQVAHESKIQWVWITLHNTGWMDHCEVRHCSVKANLIQEIGVVREAYG